MFVELSKWNKLGPFTFLNWTNQIPKSSLTFFDEFAKELLVVFDARIGLLIWRFSRELHGQWSILKV